MAEYVEIRMPPLQEGTECVVAAWLKKPGDAVQIHEPLVEIDTDKALTEVPAPASGILAAIVCPAEKKIEPGEVLGRIQVTSEATAAPAQTPAPTLAAAATSAPSALRDLSPAVRALIKQHQLDPARIRGTGRGGRITHEDVLNHLKSAPVQATSAEATPPAELKGRLVPHSQMRRRIAQHMVESLLKTAPHVTAVFEADLTALVRHRRAHQPEFQQQGVKLTYTAYFVAAAVKALQAVPEVNSRWHEDALEIFSECNIGIATALDAGLVVPVIRGAEKLDLLQIARRLQELTEKARQGRIGLADLQDATFTITNHGVSGSLIATPIINQPQSAILGIGKLEKRVVVADVDGIESLQIKPMVYVTLTIDHRVLDGFQANTFLATFVAALAAW